MRRMYAQANPADNLNAHSIHGELLLQSIERIDVGGLTASRLRALPLKAQPLPGFAAVERARFFRRREARWLAECQ
ncbi:hypothetical protein FA13DRAFT_137995 [Coprinellus micaceus]|uniref:Uncharacterized protein n=1 Tax=Coprinellus micaceus TaxID=71717 RepID=A0A4Y7SHH1_COPMI|nr:hypothetical protein FA13DRAFT_137995 [Coprinellus micaceus]